MYSLIIFALFCVLKVSSALSNTRSGYASSLEPVNALKFDKYSQRQRGIQRSSQNLFPPLRTRQHVHGLRKRSLEIDETNFRSLVEPRAQIHLIYGSPKNTKLPYVKLEDLDEVIVSLTCQHNALNSTCIELKFQSPYLAKLAKKRWSKYGKNFQVVTHHHGCNTDERRGVYRVETITMSRSITLLLGTTRIQNLKTSTEDTSLHYKSSLIDTSVIENAQGHAIEKRWSNKNNPWVLILDHSLPSMQPLLQYEGFTVYCTDCELHGEFTVFFELDVCLIKSKAYIEAQATRTPWATAYFNITAQGETSFDTDELQDSYTAYSWTNDQGNRQLPEDSHLEFNFHIDIDPYVKVSIDSQASISFGANMSFDQPPWIALTPLGSSVLQYGNWDSVEFLALPNCYDIDTVQASLAVSVGPRFNIYLGAGEGGVEGDISAGIRLAVPEVSMSLKLPLQDVDSSCAPSTSSDAYQNALGFDIWLSTYAKAEGSLKAEFFYTDIFDLSADRVLNFLDPWAILDQCFDLGSATLTGYTGGPVCGNDISNYVNQLRPRGSVNGTLYNTHVLKPRNITGIRATTVDLNLDATSTSSSNVPSLGSLQASVTPSHSPTEPQSHPPATKESQSAHYRGCDGLPSVPQGTYLCPEGIDFVCTSDFTWHCKDSSHKGVVPPNTKCKCNAFRPLGWEYDRHNLKCKVPMSCQTPNMYSLCDARTGMMGMGSRTPYGLRCQDGAFLMT